MSKEDLLRDHDKYAWECDESEHVVPYSAAEKAMDEYAKQQAIAFTKHCLQNGHLRPDEDGSVQLDYNYWHEPAFDKAAEELHNQFIEQQNKP